MTAILNYDKIKGLVYTEKSNGQLSLGKYTFNIDKSLYWEFGKQTFRDFLIKTTNPLVWEKPYIDILKMPMLHPSAEGYRLIAEELYVFISNNNIIRYTESSKKIKII
jgi:hypothetical protein